MNQPVTFGDLFAILGIILISVIVLSRIMLLGL